MRYTYPISIALKRERMHVCAPPPYQLFHLYRRWKPATEKCAPTRQNYKLRPKYPAREISDIMVKCKGRVERRVCGDEEGGRANMAGCDSPGWLYVSAGVLSFFPACFVTTKLREKVCRERIPAACAHSHAKGEQRDRIVASRTEEQPW